AKDVDRNRQQLYVVPAFDLGHPLANIEGRHLAHDLAEVVETAGLDLLDAAFRNDEGALPVIAAIQHHHHATALDVADNFVPVAFLARDTEPHHVHGRAKIVRLEAGLLAHR